MGHGDELIASGQARGAAARGKRIAFGDGQKIIWHRYANEIFLDNPNVAPPGSEFADDIEWIANHVGNRPYNYVDPRDTTRWQWKHNTIKAPGELFLRVNETAYAKPYGKGYVLVEPNVPAFKTVAPNKQWPVDRYQQVVQLLHDKGYKIIQLVYSLPHWSGATLRLANPILSPSFRHAAAFLGNAALYLGPEGGMHHAAAAMGTPAVVIFGGFIAPTVTGYPNHENLFFGSEACGSRNPCEHCRQAMKRITVEQVYDACLRQLGETS